MTGSDLKSTTSSAGSEHALNPHKPWMRKRSRWVPWHHQEDIESRQPDWIWR